jgi:hypothetical protein
MAFLSCDATRQKQNYRQWPFAHISPALGAAAGFIGSH